MRNAEFEHWKYIQEEQQKKSKRYNRLFCLLLGEPIIGVLCGIGFYVVSFLLIGNPYFSFFLALYISAIVTNGENTTEKNE